MSRLSVLRDGRVVATHELGSDTIVIGRDESSDLVLDESGISRQHLRISRTQSGYRLEDLGTENGTFVNGVREWALDLESDVTIQIGETTLLFHAQGGGGRFRSLRKREPRASAIFLSGKDLPSTEELHPAELRRLQAALRIQTKPHLVVKPPADHAGEDEYFSVDHAVTSIGYGPVSVSLGPARRATVLAEVHRDGESYELHSKGLLPKVRYKGRRTSKVPLRTGTRVEIDGFDIIFRAGVAIGS